MPSQIFKTSPPINMLFDFLKKFAPRKLNRYVFSKGCFKRAQLAESIDEFCKEIKPYYYLSKQFYTTRQIVYKHFITIIRQICKYHHIAFASEMKYSKSKYEIVYSIFIPEQLITL